MKVALTTSTKLPDSGLRIDASYHASSGTKALRFIGKWSQHQGNSVTPLRKLCVKNGIFIPGRFSRIYVCSHQYGEPWLAPSDLLKVNLHKPKYVSKKLTKGIETLRIHKGWLLLSRSGTIGNMVYVRNDMEGMVGSDDIIRIIIDKNKVLPGYVFTFLSSRIGLSLIEQKTYGAVIPHIEDHHLYDIPVPRLGLSLEKKIHDLIENTAKMRDEAAKALNQAQENIYLDIFGDNFQNYFSRVLGQNNRNYMQVNSIDLLSNGFRLDASYHASVGGQILQLLFEKNIIGISECDFNKIGDICIKDGLFIGGRAKRIYVENPKHGLPFLSSREMLYASFKNVKLISKNQPNIEDLILGQGWTLISRSGTIGNTAFVRKDMDGLTGSEHIMRVVPDLEKISWGYLFAYLSSDIGYYLITRGTFGSVVDTIATDYVASLPIPRLGYSREIKIHQLVEHAAELQTEANEIEEHAQELLIDSLNIY